MDWLAGYYDWIKAFHVISVIAWMAGMFYLPRLFVYHAEQAEIGSELDKTFQVMERKLLKLIMNPAMISSWVFGLILISLGGLDFGSIWGWVKFLSVIGMTAAHMWLGGRRKEFEAGTNTRSGRTYRLMNEVPTVFMVLIVIAVIVKPF
jgi:putative membrane protein